MTSSKLKLYASSVFAVAVIAGVVPVIFAVASLGEQHQVQPRLIASSPAAFQTASASLAPQEPMGAIPFQDPDSGRKSFSAFPNPYQPNGLKVSGPPGSLTIHLGPLRFDDRRLPVDKTMTLIETATIVATTNPKRDRIVAYSTVQGGFQTYRIPDGVGFAPIVTDNALALYLTGESIPEIAVFSVRLGAWNKQSLKVPAKGNLEPFVTPQIVLYGSGSWVYAYSTENNTWDTLELAGDREVQARLSADANIVVEDVRRNAISVFAPRIGRWATFKTAD